MAKVSEGRHELPCVHNTSWVFFKVRQLDTREETPHNCTSTSTSDRVSPVAHSRKMNEGMLPISLATKISRPYLMYSCYLPTVLAVHVHQAPAKHVSNGGCFWKVESKQLSSAVIGISKSHMFTDQ